VPPLALSDQEQQAVLDIFSRYVVGWMVAHREQAVLAQRLN
jgi:transposase InsO family protein